ncbi:MAG: HGxxPAAW family protein [Aeromicrobium sp.]|uniref:HGxxPAAW family protein n=1 Tax=Aeromicrobium sp. TaxID=1871063 RepID=UPI0039E2E351
MHGSSPASWTAVLLALVGFAVGGVGLIPEPNWLIFTIGCVLALIAAPVGWVMGRVGLGAKDH